MNRVAVVTGAARGIGAATRDLLRGEGWEVVGIDREPARDGSWVQADCAEPQQLAAVLGGIPRIDGLVNNAALQHGTPLRDTTAEQWDDVFAVNVRAAFLTTKLCAQRLAEAGGSIVNVASVHAVATSENVAPYAASKAALLGFTRAAALELADEVRVNAVVPGAVDTPALREGFARRVDEEPARSLIERTPLSRIAAASEIAQAILFLLDGERSGFITGESLTVDGGVLARLASE